MLTLQNIKQTIAGKDVAWQLETLGAMERDAVSDTDRGLLLAEKGKLLWRIGKRAEAMSAYEQGAQLDPDGPAALLLAHTNEIMDFFNPDLLNP